jgi:hypothetical protein
MFTARSELNLYIQLKLRLVFERLFRLKKKICLIICSVKLMLLVLQKCNVKEIEVPFLSLGNILHSFSTKQFIIFKT